NRQWFHEADSEPFSPGVQIFLTDSSSADAAMPRPPRLAATERGRSGRGFCTASRDSFCGHRQSTSAAVSEDARSAEPAAITVGPYQEHAAAEQQARDNRTEQQRQAQCRANARLLFLQRTDNFQHAAHVRLLPVLARRLLVGVMALHAGGL